MKLINVKNSLQWLILFAVLCLPFMTASVASAQGQGINYSGYDYSRDDPAVWASRKAKNPYEIVQTRRAEPTATEVITDAISDAYSLCERMRRPEYLVDCLGVQLELIANAMPSSGDYAEAREILEDASKQLRVLASANAAPNVPRVRTRSQIKGKTVNSKPLTPVRSDRIKQVNIAAAKIMEETETKLLRSAGSSDRRLIAYAQMAKAVGSNKTLLRSA